MTEKMEVYKRDHAPGTSPACTPKQKVEGDEMSEATARIDNLVKHNKVVLFMKGTKDQPACGFSAQVVEILKLCEADFLDVNILEDPAVRAAVKKYSNWPTLPQLYINGEFVGGCDISVELYNSGELKKLLAA